MDINNPIDDHYGSTTSGLSNEMKSYLRETGKWAKFLSILGFIAVGFIIIGALSMLLFMSAASSPFAEAGFPFPPVLFGLMYLVIAGLTIMPVLYLYRFSSKIEQALRTDNEHDLSEAFKNLKSHYKFNGIFAIVMMAIYALSIVGVLVMGAAF